MIKLYRRVNEILHYHEAWVDGPIIVEHWGKVGERGRTAQHDRNQSLDEEADLQRVLAHALASGFEPITDDAMDVLFIEYGIEGMGTVADLDKRHSLEDRINETLGWTGLGHCDGGSIGSGTMEVFCVVVDFEVAKRVVQDELKGTQFADYSRIARP